MHLKPKVSDQIQSLPGLPNLGQRPGLLELHTRVPGAGPVRGTEPGQQIVTHQLRPGLTVRPAGPAQVRPVATSPGALGPQQPLAGPPQLEQPVT